MMVMCVRTLTSVSFSLTFNAVFGQILDVTQCITRRWGHLVWRRRRKILYISQHTEWSYYQASEGTRKS